MVVIARIRVKAGSEAEAEAVFRKHIDFVVREEPGTEAFVLHRAKKDPSQFLLYERYVDGTAFDKHGKSAALQESFRAMQPILDGAPVIEIFEEVADKGRT